MRANSEADFFWSKLQSLKVGLPSVFGQKGRYRRCFLARCRFGVSRKENTNTQLCSGRKKKLEDCKSLIFSSNFGAVMAVLSFCLHDKYRDKSIKKIWKLHWFIYVNPYWAQSRKHSACSINSCTKPFAKADFGNCHKMWIWNIIFPLVFFFLIEVFKWGEAKDLLGKTRNTKNLNVPY